MTIQEIKNYMKQQKITYEKLAEMTGLSVSTITKIFGGFAKYPRVDTIHAIEQALGLSDGGAASPLTGDEEEVVNLFRGLTPQQQKALLLYLRELAGVS